MAAGAVEVRDVGAGDLVEHRQGALARGDVIRSALAAAAVRVTAGLAGGALAAVAIGRAIRSMLFGVTPLDVPSFAIAVALVVLVVSAASFVPARRAASIDPLKLLRGDAQV